jgi:glutamate formiminotransferase/formiminotetrahydrofolate cyclodeaminase
VSDDELIKIAVKSMGLDDIQPFRPEEKIIEYIMQDKTKKELIGMTLREFMNETASESPAPGGGSVSAYLGVLGVSLGTMVANLSSHKKGWDDRWKNFSDWAEQGRAIQNELLKLVDEDTDAYNQILAAYALPKKTEAEKKTRTEAVQAATRVAILVPLRVMEVASSAYGLIRDMVEEGNPNSITDAGVGALALRACIKGAYMNVRINTSSLKDKEFVKEVLLKGCDIDSKAKLEGEAILKMVEEKIVRSHTE